MYIAGSLPPMMYSDGGKKRQSPSRTSDERQERAQAQAGAPARPRRSRNRPAAAASERDAEIRDEQPFEAVAVRDGQAEDDRQRHHGADDDGPEQALLGVEPRAPVAVGDRQAEDDGSGQPATMRVMRVRVQQCRPAARDGPSTEVDRDDGPIWPCPGTDVPAQN